jgi:serine/threonine-protein kinase
MKSVLNNRYEIIEEIGSGGMAYVYKARCNVLNRFVAIKVLKAEFTKDQEFIDKFKQESMSAARLNHKNIVNIYDTGVDEDIYFIVMELVTGITLNEMIEQENPLPIGKVLDITLQICEALEHAHFNGIIHRDIKPHNILINKYNLVKVADFGIARAVTNKTITNNDNTLGSVNYLSPEQARGGYVDEKSDIYSLGIVMYELLTGERPFKGDSPISIALKHVNERVMPPSRINKEISARVDEIVLKCTNNKSTMRYNNVGEVIKDIKKIYGKSSLYGMHTDGLGSEEKNDAFNKFFDGEEKNSNVKNPVNKEKKVKSKKKEKYEDEIEEKEVVKGKFKYTLLAIIAALVVTGTVSVVALNFIKDYLTVPVVPVPSLIGLTEEVAKETVENLGLKFSVKDEIYNSEFAEGLVINQSINEGQELREKFPIEVVVSLGERLVKIPDLTHKYSNESIVILKENDLVEGDVTYEFNDTIPWGLVIRQVPEAGTMVKEDTEVSYVLSKGPEVEYILMPDLLGKHIDDVQNTILERGFAIGEITYKPSDEVGMDLVLYQSYPSGTEVEMGTIINLIVSSGVEVQIENPDEGDDISNDDTSGNGELVIELPQDKKKVHLLVERVLEDKRVIVYENQVKTETSPLTISIEGFGVQKFEIFINSEYYGVEEINFGE